MSQQELLINVVRSLDHAGIEYMVTGSLVSSLQGEPRSTHDIDLVVSVDRDSAMKLAKDFPAPEYHLDEEGIREAIRTSGMFNLVEITSGDKVDFWLLTEDAFDQERFSRRLHEMILGNRIAVSSPEDTILMKLRWSRMSGGSEKQYIDALRVYEVQSGKLDIQYIYRWAEKLEILDIVRRIEEEAEKI